MKQVKGKRILNNTKKKENILPEAKQFPDLLKGMWYYDEVKARAL